MALSEAMRKKINQTVENKTRGTTSSASGSSPSGKTSSEPASGRTYNLSSSTLDRIHRNVALKRLGREDTGVDEDFLSRFDTDYQAYLQKSIEDFDTMTYQDSRDEEKASLRKSTEDDLSDRAKAISVFLDINKGNLDEETYKSMQDYLNGFYNSRSGIRSNFKAKTNFYNQFETEDRYNAYTWMQKYQNMPYADIKAARDSQDTPSNEKEWIGRYMDSDSFLDNLTSSDIAEMQAENEQAYEAQKQVISDLEDAYWNNKFTIGGFEVVDEAKQISNQMEEAQEALKALEDRAQTLEWAQNRAGRREVLQGYDKNRGNPEFDSGVAAGRLMANPSVEQLIQYDADMRTAISNYDSDAISALQENPVQVRNKLQFFFDNKDYGGDYINSAPGSWEDIIHKGYLYNWEQLEKPEMKGYVQMYNYLLGAAGEEAADQYLDELQILLDKGAYEEQQAITEAAYADANVFEKIVMNAATIPESVFGGALAFVEDAFNSTFGSGYNPYTPLHIMADDATQVRGLTSGDIKNAAGGGFWGDIAANTYLGTMSGADSILRAYTLQGVAPIKIGNVTLSASDYAMFMGAASDKAQELYESGASDSQMVLGSITAGSIETLFEHWSLETFSDSFIRNHPESYIKAALLQSGVEGSEELFTEIANMAADAILYGANSDHSQMVQQLMLNGYSEDEAKWMATLADAEQAWWAFYGGAVSGAGMSAVGGTVNYARDAIDRNAYYSEQGRNIVGSGNLQGLIQSANELQDSDGTVKLKALANELAGVDQTAGPRTAKQQKQLEKQAGKLYAGVMDAQAKASDNASRTTFGRMVRAQLEQQGVDDVNRAAKVILKAMYDGGLSRSESELMREIGGKDIINGILNAKGADGKSTFESEAAKEAMRRDSSLVNTYMMANGAEAKPAASDSFAVNSDGDTILKAANGESESVKIKEVASIDNGTLMLSLEDGRTVNAKDISYSSSGEAVLYSAIADMGITPAAANELISGAKASGLSMANYALGVKEAYRYGRMGIPYEQISGKGFAVDLNDAQRKTAYYLGTNAAKNDSQKRDKANANRSVTGNKKGKVIYDGVNLKGRQLNDQQKAGLDLAKFLAAAGMNVHVFESVKGADGKFRNQFGSANGSYIAKNGEIYIDLAAGNSGQGTMAYTIAHEFTHFIEDWSNAKFQTFANALFEELGKSKVDVDAMVAAKLEQAGNRSDLKGKSEQELYDIAYSEVVAECCETMLADTDAMQKLADKIKEKDKGLWQKIADFFKGLAERLRKAYKDADLRPDSEIANQAKDTIAMVERLRDLWAEAGADAIRNYNAAANLTPGVEGTMVNQSGEAVAHATSDGSVQLSIRTYEEEGREALRNYLEKCVSSNRITEAEMQEMLDGIEEIYDVCKEFKDKYAPFSSWSDAAVVRDTYGKPVFSVVTPNGEYKMNLDFSLVCKKRRTLDAVFNEMSKRGIIDDFELGQKSVVKINEIIRKHGLETACALCFVDAKRFRQASMADSFTNLYNELVYSLVPEDQRSSIDHFNFSGNKTIQKVDGGIDSWENSKLDFSHLDEVMRSYEKGTVEYKAAKYIRNHPEGRKLLLRGDFMSSKGFDAVKAQNRDILKLYNSKKGTGGPKAAFGDVQYMNEIIKRARTWTPAKAYAVGGVRIQSFSDYVPRMVFDYAQMIYDLAATKLPAHAYTKEALFVKQFGLTGVKINMSLIPAIAEGGIAPGLDADGNYVWAGESFDYETAKQIQNAPGYTENCGTICVGVSKEHIMKLLGDPNIRMVIPYHKSGINAIVAHMNKIAEFTDYTSLKTNPGGCQNTMDKNGNKVAVDFSFNEVLRKTGDPKSTVRQYLDWCSKNEYTPRFAEFAWHENYYKLIEDFTLYDKDGNYVPQREVRAVFPTSESAFGSMKELIQEGLEEDAIVEGKRDKNLGAIVDEIQRVIPKTEAEIAETQVEQADRDLEAVKKSDRDYSYESLTSKPDMKVTTVGGNVPSNRADVVAQAKKNASKVGKFNPKDGSVSVYVGDIGKNVVIGTNGLKHGLRRTKDAANDLNCIVTVNAGEIIKNSIKINELTPEHENASGSYVLIGAAKNQAGDLYIVRSVVNQYDSNLASMDVLYAIKAKKWNRLRSMRPGFQGPVTDSEISISDLLDIVNEHFPDILPEGVLKHYGYDARPDGDLGGDALYSDRDSDGNQLSDDQQEYFADSKARDGSGNLYVMYHGSKNALFTEFNTDEGVWLTPDQRYAEVYADMWHTWRGDADNLTGMEQSVYADPDYRMYKLYANITNPLDLGEINDEFNRSQMNRLAKLLDVPASRIRSIAYEYGYQTAGFVYQVTRDKRFIDIAREKGYDGFTATEKGTKTFCAFNAPNQVKLTTNEVPSSFYDIRYSERVTDKDTLANLNKQIEEGKYITVYRSFQIIDGGLYAPMNAVDRDENGKNKRLGYRSQLGVWEMSTESPEIAQRYMDKNPGAPYAKFDLDGVDNKTGGVAYNPYLHSSNLVLNDQFSAAYRRNLVTVECRVPMSEIGAYKAKYAKDGTGWVDWKPGGVAGKLMKAKPEYTRKLFVSRYMLPVRIMSDAEVASMYKEYLDGTDIPVNWNVVTPGLRHELEKQGVKVSYNDIKAGKNTVKFSDVFPDEAGAMRSDRDDGGMSNRQLLANALESAVQHEVEAKKMQQYKEKIQQVSEEQKHLGALKAQIKELSFAKGRRDTAKIRALQDEATKTANRINVIDKQLLSLEATQALKNVLARERENARKAAEKKANAALDDYRKKAAATQRELMNRYQESRKKAVDSRNRTAGRHKIQKIVQELNQYLLNQSKEKHVPIELQKAVAEALSTVNMDTVGAEERIAKLQQQLAKAKTPEQIAEISRKIENVAAMGERMDEKLRTLQAAYEAFTESDDPDIANAYDEVIAKKLRETADAVGSTPLRDMNVEQLEMVYDMYKAVLHRIREANSTFAEEKKAKISTIASQVMAEFDRGNKRKVISKTGRNVNQFFWNNEKPVYAFERIGSSALTKLYEGVRKGEDTWALDIVEARKFYTDNYDSYGVDGWDFEKTWGFESTSGMEFHLNLSQIMSLYAFSKRPQAADHIRKGGIVIDENTKITVKGLLGVKRTVNVEDATTYNISDETLQSIISKLKPEQKAYVDVMQSYLSDVMGAKGNEVSMEMYGIKLFKEKNYFPLKSAGQYMAIAKEQQEGTAKIKNSGFTKSTVQKASNPIVLSPFMDVWANHVNEMSMYHAFVLPMEDFYRVYNYKTRADEKMAQMSVQAMLENACGKGATVYVDQFLKDLNGGLRADPRETLSKAMMSKFKKAAVFASASVVIQQPSAIGRAFAIIDPKYFVGGKLTEKKHNALWAECKRYAPVAIIKEMGYFDTNMGMSTTDYLTAPEYNGLKEKAAAFVKDSNYRDEVIGSAPSFADEVTWVSIWEACKREANAKYNLTGETMLQKAGERFTEVITRTQVYDSVFSRSSNMRSKSGLMSMVTAFMAEPTTSINMMENAARQWNKGYRKAAVKSAAAVLTSVIFNSILVSFVYAARDDDDDKNYLEKYLSSFTSEMLEGINPITYIPYLKDVWSLLQGYDVERADLSLINGVVSPLIKFGTAAMKDTSSMSAAQLEEQHQTLISESWKLVDNLCSILGIPEKNIRRDIMAVINMMQESNWGKSSPKTVWDAVRDSIIDSTPVLNWAPSDSKADRLYDAILSGDAVAIERAKAQYKDQDAVESAMKTAIRKRLNKGEIDAETANQYLMLYGGLEDDEPYWKIKEWEYEADSDEDYDKYGEFYDAVQTGKNLKATIKEYTDNGVEESTLRSQITSHFKPLYIEMSTGDKANIKGYLLNAMVACGAYRDDAETTLKKWEFEAKNGFNYDNRKELYLDGEITETQLRNAVMTFGGKTAEEADEYIKSLKFEAEYGFAYSDRGKVFLNGDISEQELKKILIGAGGMSAEDAENQIEAYKWQAQGYDATAAAVRDYIEYCASANVPKDIYLHIRKFSSNTKNDVVDGKTVYYSAMDKVMAEIDAQNLTSEQKDAIARSLGWSDKNIRKRKLW